MALVAEMQQNTDLTRFVISLLPSAIKRGSAHRTLVAFNAATLHDFIGHIGAQGKALDEGLVVQLVDALLMPLIAATKTKGVPNTMSKDSIARSLALNPTLLD